MKTVITGAVPAPKDVTNAPSDITQARDLAAKVLSQLLNGQIKPDLAKEAFNGIGKIIKSVSIQIDYAAIRKEKPDIPFAK